LLEGGGVRVHVDAFRGRRFKKVLPSSATTPLARGRFEQEAKRSNLPDQARLGGETVTRFKELRRIERAIENLDPTDLEWSAQYCRLRLSFVRSKQGGALWRRLARQVEDALEQIKSK
jgi:hypothetical protein